MMKSTFSRTPLCTIWILLMVAGTALAGPGDPVKSIFREYPPAQMLSVLALGDFSADPGLESVARNLMTGELVIVSLATGAVVGDFAAVSPGHSWASSPGTFLTVLVRDLDHDGLGELLLVSYSVTLGTETLGAYGFQGGAALTELWIRTENDFDPGMRMSNAQIDVAALSSTPTDEVIVSSDLLFVLDGTTGVTLYSSEPDHRFRSPTAISVDDYDADSADELLVTMSCLVGCSDPDELWLIGGSYDPGGGGGGGGGGQTPAPAIGTQFQLRASYPNPSSGRTSIAFTTPTSGRVRLRIFDASGRRVRVLADGTRAPGDHVEHWDGRDAHGVEVASGTYFYELDLDGQQLARKLLRVK